MRIWTLHPRYLDSKGLVALWREALLARAVLRGETRGYRNHPQLIRFHAQSDPLAAIESYLAAVFEESLHRGYHFDATKLSLLRSSEKIPETIGQLLFEWSHLLRKLTTRDPARGKQLQDIDIPDAHPLFHMIEGTVREWERGR
ncbi:MAG: pyrimidine dimer DNA glycosylase/endonuclease V [Anaerolineales bacterium]|jgi:hypothetical protein